METSSSHGSHQIANSRQTQLASYGSVRPENSSQEQYRDISPMDIDTTQAEFFVPTQEQGRSTEYAGTVVIPGAHHSIHAPAAPFNYAPRVLDRQVVFQDSRFFVSNVPRRTSIFQIANFFNRYAGPSLWGPYLEEVSMHGHFWVYISDNRHAHRTLAQMRLRYSSWRVQPVGVEDFHAQSHLDTGMFGWSAELLVEMYCSPDLATREEIQERWLRSVLFSVGTVGAIQLFQVAGTMCRYRVRYHDARQGFNALMNLNTGRTDSFRLHIRPLPGD
ncbi:meiosis protein MEI2 [Penicillium herquei]|nr:meiosis protein MEI2 [Penicillium herquei]